MKYQDTHKLSPIYGCPGFGGFVSYAPLTAHPCATTLLSQEWPILPACSKQGTIILILTVCGCAETSSVRSGPAFRYIRDNLLQTIRLVQEINAVLFPFIRGTGTVINLLGRCNRQDIGAQTQVRIGILNPFFNFMYIVV